MQERWAVKAPLTVYVKAVPYTFNPDHIHRDGLPGYPTLPKGMKKKARASFYKISVPDGSVVESATAAPGEKRTTTKKTTTAKNKT